MRPDRENELDLADIGRKTGAPTHGTKIASVACNPKSFGCCIPCNACFESGLLPSGASRPTISSGLQRTKFESRASEAARKRSDGIREFLAGPDRCRHARLACNHGADTTLEWRNRPVYSRCVRCTVNMGVSGPSGGRRASDSTPSHHRSHACGKLVWAIARRGNNRGRNYPRPDQDMIAEPRTGIIKHLGLQSPACSGHLCNTFSGIFHNIGGYLGLYRFLRLRWTWPGDGSAARERRRPRCC